MLLMRKVAAIRGAAATDVNRSRGLANVRFHPKGAGDVTRLHPVMFQQEVHE
jgi:hypothetical protein